MKRQLILQVMLIVMVVFLGVACSNERKANQDPNSPDKVNPPEPVTLTYLNGNGLSDEDFEVIFINPVKKKYPHITIEKTSTNNINNLIAGGETPDLISTHNGNFGIYQALDLMYDMSDLAKKYNLDLGRFDPVVIQAMGVTSPTALNAIPYALNFSALFYNKDLFDAFAVGYPADGMTWNDAIELGKRMTRKHNDVQIRGLDPYAVTRFQRILGNTFYDPQTNKATLDTPEWKFIFETAKAIISIPGNEWTDAEVKNSISPETNFYKNRISAMYAGNNFISKLREPVEQGLNWDVAQYPSFPQQPNVYNDIDAHLTFIAKTSPYKDEAMLVLIESVSDDVQLELARKTARKSPLADPKFVDNFAADIDYAKDKNIAGMFKGKMINSPVRPRYTSEASNILKTAFYDFYQGKDVNTALREADEQLNRFLAEQAN